MNKQKTLLITFLVYWRAKSQEEDCVIVPGDAGACQGERLADAQENQGKEERGVDGLTAEILEARFEHRSPVNEW